MSSSSQHIEISTDGACLGNPGPGGWAALMRAGNHQREIFGGEPATTNNRMELMAAIAALEALKRPCEVVLRTDSQYLRQGITLWLPNWIARGWKTSSGDAVKNRDLWERLAIAVKPHSISWQWVKGHSGDADNERVDTLARDEAIRQRDGQPVAQ
ncbi:MAG: ribonuclease HI [Lysobacteraceae bacterium]